MAGYIGSKSSVTQVDGYNRTEADDRYVNASGDTMTGDLTIETSGTTNFDVKSTAVNGTAQARFSNDARTYSVGIDDADNFFVYDQTSAATRINVDTSGRVIMPYQPAFSVSSNNGARSVASGGDFVFTIIGSNRGNHFNTSTNRFTAPVSGMYHFSAGVYYNSVSGSDGRAGFQKNGGYPLQSTPFVTYVRNEASVSLSMDMLLYAGDWVTLHNWDGISTINYWADHTWFSGYLIG